MFDGCELYVVSVDTADPRTVMIAEEWSSKTSFDAYQASDHFSEIMATVGSCLAWPPQSSYYEGERVGPEPSIPDGDSHPAVSAAGAFAFSGHPDATAARAERIDASGIDLILETPAGQSASRVEFDEPIGDFPAGFRVAFVRLARRARSA